MDGFPNVAWLGFFVSRKVSPSALVAAYDMARAVRDAAIPVAGGFDAPIERDCLKFLLRGCQPILVVPCRPLARFKPPRSWSDARAAGRLHLWSPFEADDRGAPLRNARRRNIAVGTLSSAVVFMYASPGGAVETLAHDLLRTDTKPIFALDLPENRSLIERGAKPLAPDDISTIRAALERP